MTAMSYEGFEALNNGDYRRAVELLERAAADAGFASDMVNHAYTLALYRAGDHAKLADVAFRIGRSLAVSDPASALDYFQRAFHAGLDEQRAREIGEIFEEWAGEHRAARLNGSVTRVGHVLTTAVPGQATTRYLAMLVRSLSTQGITSSVFTTEATASWFFNPASAVQSTGAAIEETEASLQIASVEGDFVGRAERIVESVRNAGLQLVFYHGIRTDQIATRVASMRAAPVQVNVTDEIEVAADLFDGHIHLTQNTLERSRYRDYPSERIPPASDIETRLQTGTFETPHSLGLDADTVSASFCSPPPDQVASFVNVVLEILKRFPRHFHLFAGGVEVRAIRGLLHSEGVLPRVRFLGQVADTTPLLGAVDVYLAPFPDSRRVSILEMMGAGKPVVAMRYPASSPFNTAAELVGESELTPATPGQYIQIVDRLIRDRNVRTRLGDAMHACFRREFVPERLGERYLAFIEKLR
jgi:glycosyltransferase involved in cell wall biosynthesis